MLEHLPAWLGHLLSGVRAGSDKIVLADPAFAAIDERIALSSTAFASGGTIPPQYTADGEGISPPLAWSGAPAGTASLLLVVEDAGSPTPQPLVHALVYGIDANTRSLAEGAIREGGGTFAVGKNSFGRTEWLPPDPPTGHGAHDYVFQLFALSVSPELDDGAGRGAVVAAIAGKVLATGALVGRYERPG